MWSLLWAAVFAVWSTELSWNKQACSKREASPALNLLSQIGNVTCSSCWLQSMFCVIYPGCFYFGDLQNAFPPPPHQWPERKKYLLGGCDAQTRDHVWADQLLGPPGYEVHWLWNCEWGYLYLHPESCQEHVLPGLYERQRSCACCEGTDGRSKHLAASWPSLFLFLVLLKVVVEFYL